MMKAMRFADDQAMVVDTEKGLWEIIDVGLLQETSTYDHQSKENKNHGHFKKDRKPQNITADGTNSPASPLQICALLP